MSEGGEKIYKKEKSFSPKEPCQQVAFLGVFIVFGAFSKTK
jgi:hypothetical protein